MQVVSGLQAVRGGDHPPHQFKQCFLLTGVERGEEDLVHLRDAAGQLPVRRLAGRREPQQVAAAVARVTDPA
jgi:hypothetical protein